MGSIVGVGERDVAHRDDPAIADRVVSTSLSI
jgi:hypothetical protein